MTNEAAVYIVYSKHHLEGCSEPEAVFTNRKKTQEYINMFPSEYLMTFKVLLVE